MPIKTYRDTDNQKGHGSKANHIVISNKSTNRDILTLHTESDGSASGPLMSFVRDSNSPANSDTLGKLQFKGKNDNGDMIRYGSIDVSIVDVRNGEDDAKISFTARKAGQHKPLLILRSDGAYIFNDVPLVLATASGKKTFVRGSSTTKRNIDLPDDNGTLMINNSGKVMATDLPTSDPSNEGQLWNDNGTVKISAG
jgi:hypothetical protein